MSLLTALQRALLVISSILFVQTTCASATTSEGSFSQLAFYDELRFEEGATVTRQGNLDVVDDVSICHLATLLPLSSVEGDHNDTGSTRTPFTTLGSFRGAAAMMLAMSHLNSGNGSIIPELAQTPQTCPQLRFTMELLDSQLDERKAIDHVIGMVQRNDPKDQPLPCAFVGSYRSAVSMPTSIITGLQGYPQWAAMSTSSALDNPDQFPLAGRLNPSDDGTAVAAILFFQSIQVQHLAVLHTSDAYGNAYVNGLIQAAAIHAPSMQILSVDLPFHASEEIIQRRVAKLKATGFRYFFGIIFDAVHYDPLMSEAVRQGIAGTGEHQWIFSDGVGVGRMIGAKHKPGSPLLAASRGTGMITAVGGLLKNAVEEDHPSQQQPTSPYDRLALALRDIQNNPYDLSYLSFKLPHYPEHPDYDASILFADPEFFHEPGLLAPFLYDTVAAIGLAACQEVASGITLAGDKHYQRTLQTNFDGATGRVVLNPETGTREATSALFSLTNFVQDDTNNMDPDGNVGIRAVVANVFQNGNWTTLEPYIFNDGSTVPTLDLPPSKVDANYIHTAARALILFFGCSIMILSMAFATWTKLHSSDRVVRASQPVFLFIICIGTFFMGVSVLLLSFDDAVLRSIGCQAACIGFPWALCLGFALTASALFTKTHRINLIVNQRQFRRVAVTALDVMKPMFCLVGINALTLILWNALNPAEWVRETTDYDAFGRPSHSIAYCSYEGAIPYIITLAITNVGAIFYACYEAYVARDVSTEYAESEYIFKSMATVLVVCFIGIPMAFVTEESTTVHRCTLAAVISACSLSFQLYIFVPKIKFNRQAIRDVHGNSNNTASRRQSGVFRVSSTRSLSSESTGEEFGVRVFNRKHRETDLVSEVHKLKKQNMKLQMEINTLKAGRDESSLELTRQNSSKSVTFDESSMIETTSCSIGHRSLRSIAVSEAESIITIDPLHPDDESNLDVAPF
ncbi:Gamma-aminobutyric acid (GABA) B receptor [Seminavis robusta]|uniref:Gamma-aminobutyric acid (GABA) B receptor n=1 Tax=Seminavis robusta TaxID=568900 RepID=A0A9N8ED89_9STRA|nr:Gamma-aminobutyric acid (GABA) B receptor [Seminavis robusta]|eukprot:Sro921_g220340.1 Gamma-aminobutyric acid (GABA) B receptor (969) ;mRNA; f:6483-9472